MLAQARPPMINHLTSILCCFVSILLGVSVALMLALCTLSCCCLSVQMFQKLSCLPYVLGSVLTCVQFVQVFQKLSCLPYVFGSVLACAKSAHVFQKLSYLLCGLCLSLSSLIHVTLPQTVRLFYVSTFHCVLRLPNSSTPCFSFLLCEGMATVTN